MVTPTERVAQMPLHYLPYGSKAAGLDANETAKEIVKAIKEAQAAAIEAAARVVDRWTANLYANQGMLKPVDAANIAGEIRALKTELIA